MCGRAACTLAPSAIEDRYKPAKGFRNADKYNPSFNIAPYGNSAYLPILSLREDATSKSITTDVCAMQWGLIPVWHKEGTDDAPMNFNARFETLKEKKLFNRLLSRKRCVVLMDGFYEWTHESIKQPYFFKFKGGEPLALAGLMDVWHSSTGETIESFTIITTTAPSSFSFIHNRMPAILNDSNMTMWLDPTTTTDTALKCLCDPENIGLLLWYPVTRSVGHVSYNQKDCVEEINSAKHPPSTAPKSENIKKFFKPIQKAGKQDSPTRLSRFFSAYTSPSKKDAVAPTSPATSSTLPSSPLKSSSPSSPITDSPCSPSRTRDFDEEVGDFPVEVLDWPEVSASPNQPSSSSMLPSQLQTPPQTVPHTPDKADPSQVPSSPTMHSARTTPLSYSRTAKSKRRLDFEPVSSVPVVKKQHS